MVSEGVAGMDKLATEILDFWTGVGMKGWYTSTLEFDTEITDRFKEAWDEGMSNKLTHWQLEAKSALALIILLDQFPRNMFRGEGTSFSSDNKALCVAKKAINQDLDKQIDGEMRQFFYMPFMHSESMMDQDCAVRAFCTRMPGTSNLLHARAHRQVIRDFGRFPFRNVALGRESTEKEVAYLAAGAYSHTVENLDK
jgi:uncharacterized protein (DUF924 family)